MASLKTCKIDGSWMAHTYSGDNIIFTCQRCGESIKGDDTDRNRKLGGQIDTTDIQLRRLMKYAHLDPANPTIHKDCQQCGKKTLCVYVEMQQKKRYFKCKTCQHEVL